MSKTDNTSALCRIDYYVGPQYVSLYTVPFVQQRCNCATVLFA